MPVVILLITTGSDYSWLHKDGKIGEIGGIGNEPDQVLERNLLFLLFTADAALICF